MIIAILVYLGIGFFGSAIKERFFPEVCCGFIVEKTSADILIYTLFWPFLLIGKLLRMPWDFISGNL